MRRFNLFVITLAVALPAAAEIYQWRDADGRVHFSDTPPLGQKATLRGGAKTPTKAPTPDVSTEPAAAEEGDATKEAAEAAAPAADGKGEKDAADAAKPKTSAEREVEFRQRRAAAAEAEAKAADARRKAEERQRDCERARNQLAALESGKRMARYGSDGERVVLDDAARGEEIGRSRKAVDNLCK